MPCNHPDRNESPKKAHMVLGGGWSFPLLVSSHTFSSGDIEYHVPENDLFLHWRPSHRSPALTSALYCTWSFFFKTIMLQSLELKCLCCPSLSYIYFLYSHILFQFAYGILILFPACYLWWSHKLFRNPSIYFLIKFVTRGKVSHIKTFDLVVPVKEHGHYHVAGGDSEQPPKIMALVWHHLTSCLTNSMNTDHLWLDSQNEEINQVCL